MKVFEFSRLNQLKFNFSHFLAQKFKYMMLHEYEFLSEHKEVGHKKMRGINSFPFKNAWTKWEKAMKY